MPFTSLAVLLGFEILVDCRCEHDFGERAKEEAGQPVVEVGWQGDLIITSKGQPVAVLLRIAAASVESTRSLLRSVRELQAQAALQQAATANGRAGLTLADIDAEIAAARRARPRK
jgi:hypothetical protein